MQKNILWTGIEYHSLENCLLTTSDQGANISSVIVGVYNQAIYKVEYDIQTNKNWETIFFEIRSRIFNRFQTIRFQRDGKGNWLTNGEILDQFSGCIDIDIPLTPFTNTLPINRLNLSQHEAQEISVIYLDLLEQKIQRVNQKYTRISHSDYKYENVPNDFGAGITVDQFGIVVNYPTLFVRTAMQESNYF